jgi:ppGpp synthetase/RelA/SpoT-type nucleotidyltranferase
LKKLEAMFDGAHSVSARVKTVDSLIAKIVDRMAKDPARGIRLNNYRYNITDIIGIRILHIFKTDSVKLWEQITHAFAKSQREKPTLYLRKGDSEKTYENILNSVERMYVDKDGNDTKYRSIHYLFNDPLCVWELQTRTLFQEGWAAIDHDVIYKGVSSKDWTLQGLSDALSRVSGTADDLAWLIGERNGQLANGVRAQKANAAEPTKEDAQETVWAEKMSEYLDTFFEDIQRSEE